MTTTTAALAKGDHRASWVWHLCVLAALVALILLIFNYETVNAVQVWWIYDTYTHCFLIIPISAWLVWQKRGELQLLVPQISPAALFLIPPILFLWLIGKYATINEVRQFAVVGLIEVAALTMLGLAVYRAILFPMLYLFFLIPVGQYLVPPMQEFATWFTDTGLTVLGVPHYTEGTLIELPTGRFEIAEACAGLRFMIATVTLGVLFTHLSYRRWYKHTLFLVASVLVPLIGNGLRCIAIILLAYYTSNRVAVGADHLIYGWFFNIAILLVLFFAGNKFRDTFPPPGQTQNRHPSRDSLLRIMTFASLTAVTVYLGPAYANWRDGAPVVVNEQSLSGLVAFSPSPAVQQGQSWKPLYSGADREIVTRILPSQAGAIPVDLAIEYYGRMREGHSIIATTNRLWDPTVWRQLESRRRAVSTGKATIPVAERVLWSPSERRLLWSVYWMDGTFTTSATTIKLLQLKTAFVGNPAGALVALSTPIDGTLEDARRRLNDALSLMPDLRARLSDAGHSGPTRTSSD